MNFSAVDVDRLSFEINIFLIIAEKQNDCEADIEVCMYLVADQLAFTMVESERQWLTSLQ